VALGEVRRWANTCDDEGGRLYALPLVDAYEELRAENERLRAAALKVVNDPLLANGSASIRALAELCQT